ncbi:MAG: glycoside hydrolase family 88 protein [Spirochaetaceae bacterium]
MKLNNIFKHTEEQMRSMLKQIAGSDLIPRSTNNDGTIRLVEPADWTSGFFAGCLWQQYESTKDEFWKTASEKYTDKLIKQQFNKGDHDIGFRMFCSYGSGYRLTDNSEYIDIILQSAESLSSRFDPNVGCIRSWDFNKDKWQFPVIIDNMMNLELLFWASKKSGNPKYREIAISHAETTLKNQFRDDNSCYHVIDYNPTNGEVLHRHTHQGFSNDSTWNRGQSWAIYGYTMCYRETGDQKFLDHAVKVADMIMNHKNLPADGVPYWDFDDTDIPNAPRDASAAAIISSGLYEMVTYLKEDSDKYMKFADKLITSLTSREYLAEIGANNCFLLKHSVGSKPENDEVDKPIIYGDYYFLEALLRKRGSQKS